MAPPPAFDPLSILPSATYKIKAPELVIAEREAQWMFTDEELARPPSVEDGMPLEQERDIRTKGLHFISQVGIMVKLPQLTLSTASIFFNRFLMRYSMVPKPGSSRPLHHYQIAGTALFLSTKTTETPRKLRELVTACCRVAQKKPTLVVHEDSKDFWRWRDTLLYNEDVLLETLCFDVSVMPPHRALFDLLRRIGEEHNKPLRSSAWAFLNDAAMTVLSLRFDARTVAAAAIYAAARSVGESCRFADDERGRPWWTAQNVRLRDIRLACNVMAELYEADPEKMSDPSGDTDTAHLYLGLRTPVEGDEDEAKTRLKRDGDTGNGTTATNTTDDASAPPFEGPALMGTEREMVERKRREAGTNGVDAESERSSKRQRRTARPATNGARGDKDEDGEGASEEGELEE